MEQYLTSQDDKEIPEGIRRYKTFIFSTEGDNEIKNVFSIYQSPKKKIECLAQLWIKEIDYYLTGIHDEFI